MAMQGNLVIIKSCISRQHCLLLTCKKSVENKPYIKRVYKKIYYHGIKSILFVMSGVSVGGIDTLIVRIDDDHDNDDDGGGGGV